MTTTQMAYFVAMVEKLSFTSVAELFYVTQPTLSRQIMNLEAELDTRLFVRERNTVTVTPAGMALYDGLKPLYGQLIRLIDSVKHYDELQRQTFTIGIAEELLLDDPVQLAIGMFSGKHPEVNVSIVRASYAKLQRGLLDGTISVAIPLPAALTWAAASLTIFISLWRASIWHAPGNWPPRCRRCCPGSSSPKYCATTGFSWGALMPSENRSRCR